MDKATEKQVRALLLDVLRHDPDAIGLALDEDGFVPLADFLYCANLCQPVEYTEDTLRAVVEAGEGSLFNSEGDKVRAIKGHTTSDLDYPIAEPPEHLYYLVKVRDRSHIEEQGLEPVKEKWVPLETTEEGARSTKGRRRIKKPILVSIRAKEAWSSGVSFYNFCGRWYSQYVDATYIHLSSE